MDRPRLPRLQLFEFNDLDAVPAALRDTIVESLSRTLAWGHILSGLVEPFEAFLTAAGTREVLDLGSGAGGPAAVFIDEFAARGLPPPHFLLTDLHPRPHVWAQLKAARPEALDFVAESVDATSVPPSLGAGRVRTLINILHHLPPALAKAVLLDACRTGAGVFVAESFDRDPRGFTRLWSAGLPALLANPYLTTKDRAAKIALTWLTPTALLVGLWDGFVSTMRVYSEAELREMVAPLGDAFDWEYGRYDYLRSGRGYYFRGVPREPPA